MVRFVGVFKYLRDFPRYWLVTGFPAKAPIGVRIKIFGRGFTLTKMDKFGASVAGFGQNFWLLRDGKRGITR